MSVPATSPRAPGLLTDRGVLITAAAGTGIGSAAARRCIAEGARVMISDRHAARLEALAAELALPARVCDVTDAAQIDDLFADAAAQLGGVDVLINNAGLGLARPLVEIEDDDWSRVLDVTLHGTFRCTRAALRHMRERGRGGAIVNIGSVTAWRAEAGQTAYAAAKAGVLALTRCAALEAAEFDVRVNAVVPTIAMHANLAHVASADYLDAMTRLQPLGRAAEPREIADAIVFLASDLASYMTGEALSVSGQHP